MRYLLVILLFSCSSVTISKEINSIDNLSPISIFFAFNSSEYHNSSNADKYKREYTALKSIFDNDAELILEIHGFQNSKEKNKLAKQRAYKVKDELIKIGFNKGQIITRAEPVIILTDSIRVKCLLKE